MINPSGLPTIVRDSREKEGHGYNFVANDKCAGMIIEKLDFGDYALKDRIDLISIERKSSVTELCGNLGRNRKRFEKELQRMVDAGVKRKYIIVEDHWSSIYNKSSYCKMPGHAMFESIIALQLKYDLHFIFAGSKKMAQRIVRSLLIKAWNYNEKEIL